MSKIALRINILYFEPCVVAYAKDAILYNHISSIYNGKKQEKPHLVAFTLKYLLRIDDVPYNSESNHLL